MTPAPTALHRSSSGSSHQRRPERSFKAPGPRKSTGRRFLSGRPGLASTPNRGGAGNKTVKIARVRITKAGRRTQGQRRGRRRMKRRTLAKGAKAKKRNGVSGQAISKRSGAVRGRLREIQPFIQTTAQASIRLKGREFVNCLRASLSKSFEFCLEAYKDRTNHIAFFLAPSIRQIWKRNGWAGLTSSWKPTRGCPRFC